MAKFNIMAELEKRRGGSRSPRMVTAAQIEFIKVARSGDPVTFPIMAELWMEEGWGTINADMIARIFHQLKAAKKI
jgi:hypothetical protein